MDVDQLFVILAALLLGLASGANDGAALLSMAVSGRSPAPLPALALLLVALVMAPGIVGVHVASTLAGGLVRFPTSANASAIAIAVITSVTLITLLSMRGLPTSITLALVGSVVGVGLGLGLTPNWELVAWVGGLGLLAPAASLVIGRLIALPVARLGVGRWRDRRAGVMSAAAYAAQVFAYSANDGQRLAAVLLGGQLLRASPGPVEWLWLTAAALAFGLGCFGGISSIYRRLGRSVILARPEDATISQLASATVVVSGAAIGIPISMTQSSAAALIGAGLARGHGRIRWRAATDVGLAWVVTLPLSVGAGTLAGFIWASVPALPQAGWR